MKPTRRYDYVGQVETGSRYIWRSAYSYRGELGGYVYPWLPYRAAQAQAKRDGFKAVFYMDGKPRPRGMR